MDEQYGQLIERHKQVAFTFGAPGWYVLGVVLLLVIAVVVRLGLRSYRKNRYRRQALMEMKTYAGDATALYRTNMLLKRIAMTRYGRAETAGIRGKEWIAFLNKSRGRELFGAADAVLLDQLYAGGTGVSRDFTRESERMDKETQILHFEIAYTWIFLALPLPLVVYLFFAGFEKKKIGVDGAVFQRASALSGQRRERKGPGSQAGMSPPGLP